MLMKLDDLIAYLSTAALPQKPVKRANVPVVRKFPSRP